MRTRLLMTAGIAAMATALAGCQPIVSQHGYAPTPTDLAEIVPGQDTRGSVRRKIGRPSTDGVFSEDGWYYVSTELTTKTWNAPEVTDRRVVAVRFGEDDVVAAVNEFGVADGQVIDLQTRTTPTFGRELTIIQQIFSNVGSIGAEDVFGDQ